MAHIHELIDFTVNVFVVYKDKVLLRFHDKYNFWGGSASGHIELNETPEEAVMRETKEEVGLNIKIFNKDEAEYTDNERVKKIIPPVYQDIHKISDSHKHIGMVYFGTSETDKVEPKLLDDRSDTWKWVTKDELEKMDMWEDQKFYAKKALETLGKQK
jgi:8-oxo-dGTP pyrophosphatase MutT (NUDIX family)